MTIQNSPQNPARDDQIRISCGEGYGGQPYRVGEVLRDPRNKNQILYVLSASSRYYREDGMSFGVGNEEGYVYTAQCRIATEPEAAPLLAREAAREARKRSQARLAEIEHLIVTAGERPEGSLVLQGEVVAQRDVRLRIYGGGSWYVIAHDKIWFVRNNGADGDDWSQNNIVTGGAGAIGWAVPYDSALADELRALDRILK